MTESKIAEAEVLWDNSHFDAAYYLCGYAVEFALKSAICNKLGVEMFEPSAEVKDISKSFKIHRLSDLMILSSLRQSFEDSKAADVALSGAWSLIQEWSEQKRYDVNCDSQTAFDFIEAVKIFKTWIENHW